MAQSENHWARWVTFKKYQHIFHVGTTFACWFWIGFVFPVLVVSVSLKEYVPDHGWGWGLLSYTLPLLALSAMVSAGFYLELLNDEDRPWMERALGYSWGACSVPIIFLIIWYFIGPCPAPPAVEALGVCCDYYWWWWLTYWGFVLVALSYLAAPFMLWQELEEETSSGGGREIL